MIGTNHGAGRSFEIQVRGQESSLRSLSTAAWLTPSQTRHRECPSLWRSPSSRIFCIPFRGQQLGSRPAEPNIRAFFCDNIRYMVDDRFFQKQFPQSLHVKAAMDTPCALARDAPVGTIFDHAHEAIFAHAGTISRYAHFLRLLEQVIVLHGDEPLLGCAEDDGFLHAAVR